MVNGRSQLKLWKMGPFFSPLFFLMAVVKTGGGCPMSINYVSHVSHQTKLSNNSGCFPGTGVVQHRPWRLLARTYGHWLGPVARPTALQVEQEVKLSLDRHGRQLLVCVRHSSGEWYGVTNQNLKPILVSIHFNLFKKKKLQVVIWNSKTGSFVRQITIPSHYQSREDDPEAPWQGHTDFAFAEDGLVIVHNKRNFPIAADILLFWWSYTIWSEQLCGKKTQARFLGTTPHFPWYFQTGAQRTSRKWWLCRCLSQLWYVS